MLNIFNLGNSNYCLLLYNDSVIGFAIWNDDRPGWMRVAVFGRGFTFRDSFCSMMMRTGRNMNFAIMYSWNFFLCNFLICQGRLWNEILMAYAKGGMTKLFFIVLFDRSIQGHCQFNNLPSSGAIVERADLFILKTYWWFVYMLIYSRVINGDVLFWRSLNREGEEKLFLFLCVLIYNSITMKQLSLRLHFDPVHDGTLFGFLTTTVVFLPSFATGSRFRLHSSFQCTISRVTRVISDVYRHNGNCILQVYLRVKLVLRCFLFLNI